MSAPATVALLAAALSLAACANPPTVTPPAPTQTAQQRATALFANAPAGLKVLATTTIMADIARNVTGDRVAVDVLLPAGADPHSFQPTPADVKKVADSTVLIANGAGFEQFLDKLLANAGGERLVIEGARGLTARRPGEGEPAASEAPAAGAAPAGDPHFYLDPLAVKAYVDNIAAGLSQADPAGAPTYTANATAAKANLTGLDAMIGAILKDVPEADRILVTDHDDLGYFADRYGFTVAGMIVPSFSSEAAPSARQLADLVDIIKATGAKAIFTEANANPQLARQIAAETGVRVVSDLYTHSLSAPDGPAGTYLDLTRHNAKVIAAALRGN